VYALSQRRSVTIALILAALTLLVAVGVPAVAGPEEDAPRAKYYLVTASDAEQPRALAEIALRLLGEAERADEIVALTADRPQPDGGRLTGGATLKPGWVLILPWDAVGDGVRYGPVPSVPAQPTTPAATATNPGSGNPSTTAAAATPPAPTASPGSAAPTASPGSAAPESASPSPTASASAQPTTPPAAPADACPTTPAATPAGTRWAQQRLSPQDAWTAGGRGSGVIVAVVDSGVDARVPQLSGRVSGGVDIVAGTLGGTTDCLGSGTAMAALIVGDDEQEAIGLAPDATVLPVRVATDKPEVAAVDQATAIAVAVSAGARVIAVGSYVDATLPEVRQAIEEAARHDVVVVVAGPVPDDGSLPPQVLRVGVLNQDGQLDQEYPPGTIDVVAPGQDVTSLGPAGQGQVQVSGAQYAVAFVAGAAALVRGASPGLTAEEVAQRLRTTATPIETPADGTAAPADTTVALVNPAKAVIQVNAAAPPRVSTPQAAPDGGARRGTLLASVAVLVLLILGGVLLLRRRPLPTTDWGVTDQATADDRFQQP
jgi:membrane-anchored mycosin MYCP